jgi:hypothetical protein
VAGYAIAQTGLAEIAENGMAPCSPGASTTKESVRLSASAVVRPPRIRRCTTSLLAVAATAGVLAVGVPSANAAPASQGFKSVGSYRYAGYRSVAPAPSASVTFTVPTLSCEPGKKLSAVELGVTVLTGAAPAFASALVVCYGTQASYEGFLDVNGKTRGVSSLQAGDTVRATETLVGSKVTLRLDNLTTNTHSQLGGKLAGAARSLEVGVLGLKTGAAPPLGVPDFHSVNFTNVALGGKPLNPTTAVRNSRITPDGRKQISTSEPSANATSFSAQYVSS